MSMHLARAGQFFRALEHVCFTNRLVVLGGDFNVSLDRAVATEGSLELRTLCNPFHLVDANRVAGPSGPSFTWSNSQGYRSRLDYLFIPRGQEVREFVNRPTWAFDHNVVGVTVVLSEQSRGWNFWWLNASLLQDKAFCEAFCAAF